MNKRILSLITAAALVTSSAAVLADAPTVNVVVNGAVIDFADQNAVIKEDRTLIPARGAFEAMGAKVEWDGEARTVTVKNDRNTKVALLTIDSNKMVVTTYTSLFDSTQQEITLDVPAQIMNDRTMIPLRAVGEAMDAKVEWDGETYTASITTTAGEKAQEQKDKVSESLNASENTEETTTETEAKLEMAALSLSQGEAASDDEVVVLVDLKGMDLYPEYSVLTVTVGLDYDPSVLQIQKAELVNGDTVIEGALGSHNPTFKANTLKATYITTDRDKAVKSDASVMKMTFNVLKDEATEVKLSSRYDTTRGYDTKIGISKEAGTTEALSGTSLFVDETPLKING